MYKHFYVVYKLMNSTVSFSTVFIYVTEALHGMEAVAEHINEMQKIYEEYGSTFDELAKQYRDYYPHSKVPVSDVFLILSANKCEFYKTAATRLKARRLV